MNPCHDACFTVTNALPSMETPGRRISKALRQLAAMHAQLPVRLHWCSGATTQCTHMPQATNQQIQLSKLTHHHNVRSYWLQAARSPISMNRSVCHQPRTQPRAAFKPCWRHRPMPGHCLINGHKPQQPQGDPSTHLPQRQAQGPGASQSPQAPLLPPLLLLMLLGSQASDL